MIPSTHWSICFRGKSGAGKTTMVARVIKELSKRENMKIIAVCTSKLKQADTFKIYDDVLGDNYRQWKGVSYMHVRNLRDTILVIEDTPMFMSTKRRRKFVTDMVTALARANRVFVVLVAQIKIGISMPINVRLYLNIPNYRYRVTEGRNASAWYNWTDRFDNINPVLDAIYYGVEGEEVGDVGRPVNTDSKMQKIYGMFSKGLDPKQVVGLLGYESQSTGYNRVYVYYTKWKRKQKQLRNNK